ncbi:MAG: hypothetical protein KC931_25845 [Candidatus Omnitrophica bacterium]|nr:hypothetical protein [Candidatus Omnitrophota bacterium]MCA9450571.1 hypothetical protein [Candidatus Omnitrophota bacterium]MCB9768590.1 hypothetical protein [Candidatus Omnitrophota bacterium]
MKVRAKHTKSFETKEKGNLEYTGSGVEKEREADEDIRAGRVKSFDNVEDLIKDLNNDRD